MRSTRRSNSARSSLGGRYEMGASRLLSSRSGMVLQLVTALQPSPRLASSPFTPAPPGGPGGLTRPPWSMGVRRESRHLPPGRSRRRNAGRGPGRESPGRGLQGGATMPLARWVQGEPKSPWSRCNGDDVASAGTGSMPVSVKRPADQSLGDSAPKGGVSLGIALGGPRGMGNPPAR